MVDERAENPDKDADPDGQAGHVEPAGPLPYREITEDAYATAAARDFTVTVLATGMLVLRGPCPRCRSVIDIPSCTILSDHLGLQLSRLRRGSMAAPNVSTLNR